MKAIFVTFFLVVATREVVGMKNWTNSKDDQNFKVISFIVIIVLSCALAASYLLNIWFTYYVYCKTKRRRKRHLTAVQQKALTRKNISQNGLDNLALDSERGENLSTSVDEVLGQDVIYRSWSGRVRSEDTPVSNAASQQGEDQHVYQRLQSCVFDPLSQDYLEIPESVGHRQTNQPEMRGSVKSPKRPSYKFVPPHLPVAAESKKDNKSGQEENHLYEKLLLRNGFPDEAQASSAEQDLKETSNSALRTSIPDYVEIISDDVLAANTKKLQSTTPTSQETSAIVDNAYEIPITVPALYKESKASTCAVHKENYESTRGEDTEEADYMELLNENKASKKDNTIANKENT